MRANRRNLQAQPKMLKEIAGTSNQPIRTKKFPKKVCLVPQKCIGAKNSYGGYPTEFAGSTQSSKKKIIGTSNQPIRTKIFPKKVCLVLKSVKGPKFRMGANRRNPFRESKNNRTQVKLS
jgi:hypothetical protein